MVAVTEAINVLASPCGSDLLCRSKRADIRYLPVKEKQLLVLLSEFCLWIHKHARGAESTRCQRTSEIFSEITVAGSEGLRLKTQRQQKKEQRCVMTTAHNQPPPIPRLSSDIHKGCEVWKPKEQASSLQLLFCHQIVSVSWHSLWHGFRGGAGKWRETPTFVHYDSLCLP